MDEDKDREFVNIWEADDKNALIPKELIDKAVDPGAPTVDELAKKFDAYVRETSKGDEFSIPTRDFSPYLDKILEGGLRPGELCAILSGPGPYKSDIFRSLYFKKLKLEHESGNKQPFSLGALLDTPLHEEGLFVTPLPDDFRDIGMRAYQDDKGSLIIDSYNLIMPETEDELRAFHRRNQSKPTLVAAAMAMAIRANRAVSTMSLHANDYDSPWPIVEKEESQLAKERKHVPYQHPKKRPVKLNPLLKGLIKQIKE